MNTRRNALGSSGTLLFVIGLAGCASLIGVDDPAYQPDAGQDASPGGSSGASGKGGGAGAAGLAGAGGSAGHAATGGSAGQSGASGAGGQDASVGGQAGEAGQGGSAGEGGSAGGGGLAGAAGEAGSGGIAGSGGASGAGGATGGSAGAAGGCGDNVCDTDETKASCCTDCGCETSGYSCVGNVCLGCGDGTCTSGLGETPSTCCADCGCSQQGYACVSGQCIGCGDGICNGSEDKTNCCTDCGCATSGYTCSSNVCLGCGDGSCTAAIGENKTTCCADCGCATSGYTCVGGTCEGCGDAKCNTAIGENSNNCCVDCGCASGSSCKSGTCVPDPTCKDGTCNGTETKATCCVDCGCDAGFVCNTTQNICQTKCGDGICAGGENSTNCCADCACATGYACQSGTCKTVCGDTKCVGAENYTSCCKDCACPSGFTCQGTTPGACGTVCGDGICAGSENYTSCCKDCACPTGYQCQGNTPGTCNTVCGDGVCAGGETAANCCSDCKCGTGLQCTAGGCTLGDWFYVTTSQDSAGAIPRTVRGNGTFSVSNAYTGTWGDSNKASGSDSFTLSLAPDGAATWSPSGATGQMAVSRDLMILNHPTSPNQTVFLRKGSGLSKSMLKGDYKVVGILGRTTEEFFFDYGGNMTFDSSGCVVQATSVGQNSMGLAISFKTGSCATVASNGEMVFPHTQIANNTDFPNTWRGYMGMGGEFLLLTPDASSTDSSLKPGTILMVKRTSGHGAGKVKGTYRIGHLAYNDTTNASIDVRGTLSPDGAGVLTAGTSLVTSSNVTATIQAGSTYLVQSNGLFACHTIDSVSSGYQVGLAGTYSTSSGYSSVIISHAATAQDPALYPTRGSLMIWVRSWTP